MKVQNKNYDMFASNKARNLVMLGDNKAGNDFLKGIADTQHEPEVKKKTLSFMNKSKKEIVEMMTASQQTATIAGWE